jgi:hypothetical protein
MEVCRGHRRILLSLKDALRILGTARSYGILSGSARPFSKVRKERKKETDQDPNAADKECTCKSPPIPIPLLRRVHAPYLRLVLAYSVQEREEDACKSQVREEL